MGEVPFGRPRRRRPTPSFDRAAYDRAARRQASDRELSPTPVPARITIALDLRGLFGDQVDRDLGVWEPPAGWSGPWWEPGTAVDRWEAGTLVPTREQVIALARLTATPWRFFYLPIRNWPGRVFMCERRRGGRGLTVVSSAVDHNGVLYYEPDDDPDDELPIQAPARRPAKPLRPAKPRRPAKHKGSATTAAPVDAHRFDRDDSDSLVCRVCGLPERNRWHVDHGSKPKP